MYKSIPDTSEVLRITVLGAVLAPRDALVAALARHVANTGAAHHISTAAGGDVTLLLGLNRSDALPGTQANLADQSLRRQLNDTHQHYQVLYGLPGEQLTQAVRILHIHQRTGIADPAQPTSPQRRAAAWRWACDKCSDPVCEHKLLTDLLAQRTPRR